MTERTKAQLRLNRTSEFTGAHDLIIRVNWNFTLNIFDNLLLIRAPTCAEYKKWAWLNVIFKNFFKRQPTC